MKVKIFPEKGQTRQQAEEQLEKAFQTKREALEERYAKESYQNAHLDDFHEHVMDEYKGFLESLTKDISDIIKKG